jgi:hypothetical protein
LRGTHLWADFPKGFSVRYGMFAEVGGEFAFGAVVALVYAAL